MLLMAKKSINSSVSWKKSKKILLRQAQLRAGLRLQRRRRPSARGGTSWMRSRRRRNRWQTTQRSHFHFFALLSFCDLTFAFFFRFGRTHQSSCWTNTKTRNGTNCEQNLVLKNKNKYWYQLWAKPYSQIQKQETVPIVRKILFSNTVSCWSWNHPKHGSADDQLNMWLTFIRIVIQRTELS